MNTTALSMSRLYDRMLNCPVAVISLSMSRLYDRMLNCPVAVISGCRTYNDKAIIADYGLKEATKILELNGQ